MSYRHDGYLVISNKFGAASAAAKAQLFETYDQLRDITVSSASGATGSGFEGAGGFLYNLASLFSPAAFSPMMSGRNSYSIPGTSYYSSGVQGSSAYGLEHYAGFAAPINGYTTGKAAPLLGGFGSATGYASSIGGIANIASSAAYGTGTLSGFSNLGRNIVLQGAGLISGFGGIMQSAAPYMGEYGLGAVIVGNIMRGSGSAALAALQNAAGAVTANADTILTNKVKNLETVAKMLDTQGSVIKKMLKSSTESNSKAIQNL